MIELRATSEESATTTLIANSNECEISEFSSEYYSPVMPAALI